MQLRLKAFSSLAGVVLMIAAFSSHAAAFVVGYGAGGDLNQATQDAISHAQEECENLGYTYSSVRRFNTVFQFGLYFVEAEALCT